MQEYGSGKLWRFLLFFKPSFTKLIFLGAWGAFTLIELLRGKLNSPHMFCLIAYPFAFFYILACILTTANKLVCNKGATFKLMALGLGLSFFDQVVKLWLLNILPYGASQPILNGWLHLVHHRNQSGSWVLQTLGFGHSGLLIILIMIGVAAVLLLSGLVHRYYSTLYRYSFWADITFIMYFAGFTSFLADMLLRGYILDYISLPGLVTVDLKDIFLTVGTAALIAEVLENPGISLRWKGLQVEWTELKMVARGLYDFGKADLRRLR